LFTSEQEVWKDWLQALSAVKPRSILDANKKDDVNLLEKHKDKPVLFPQRIIDPSKDEKISYLHPKMQAKKAEEVKTDIYSQAVIASHNTDPKPVIVELPIENNQQTLLDLPLEDKAQHPAENIPSQLAQPTIQVLPQKGTPQDTIHDTPKEESTKEITQNIGNPIPIQQTKKEMVKEVEVKKIEAEEDKNIVVLEPIKVSSKHKNISKHSPKEVKAAVTKSEKKDSHLNDMAIINSIKAPHKLSYEQDAFIDIELPVSKEKEKIEKNEKSEKVVNKADNIFHHNTITTKKPTTSGVESPWDSDEEPKAKKQIDDNWDD
jgi:hypothetical protein